MKKNKRKLIANIILLISIIVFIIVIVSSLGDIEEIYTNIINCNYKYILIILGLLVVYFILWPLSLAIIIKSEEPKVKLSRDYQISATEFFFNGITPFSSGGQPFQVYSMHKVGISVAKSTSIIMINFIIYQIVINIFSVLSIALYFNTIRETISNFIWLAVIGFSINFIILIFLIAIAISRKTGVICHKFLAWLGHFKLLKRVNNIIPAFDQYIIDAQDAFKKISKKWKIVLFSTFLKIIALAIFYAIPFFGIRALNIDINYDQIFYVIAMTCFALTMVVWLPTPGSSGGVEFTFNAIFKSLGISTNNSLSLMLIWRFATYYLVMLFGLIVYLILERLIKRDENRNIYGCLLPEHQRGSDLDKNSRETLESDGS